MKKVTITARALGLVEEYAKWFETQQGPGYVPVIVWQTGDTSNPHFVPQLTLAFGKHDVVDRSRVMECDGRDVEVFQEVPDVMFGADGQKFVDTKDNVLVIVDANESAS
jgi:hypothetical protein